MPSLTNPTTPPTPRPRDFRRFLATVGLVLALFGGAVVARLALVPPAVKGDPLRGDSDEASATLAAQMSGMPAAKQGATLKRYLSDPAPGLRYAAADYIGAARRDPADAALLRAAYADSASIVRQRVLETLPDLDRDAGLHLLLAGLRDEDSWLREAAVQQIKTRAAAKKSIVDKRALPSLIAALDDPDDVVPFAATSILIRLTKNPWRYRALAPAPERATVLTRWKKWWAIRGAATTAALPPAFAAPVLAEKPTRVDLAPAFTLRDTEGRSLNLDGQRGRVTLLNFWGTWCPPCQKEVPDLVRLDADYRARGVDVIGIAVGERDGAAGLKKWCAAHGVAYRQTLAVESVQQAFGDIHEVPVSVLIDGQGRIRRRWEGERDYGTFRAAVEDVLRGE